MDKNNRKIRKEKVKGKNGEYISEVQEFETPEGYRDAFKRYYPENEKKEV